MIIASSFILLNFPKTGSTFVRTVLKEIFKQRVTRNSKFRELLFKLNILRSKEYQELMITARKNQHGAYSQIPKEFIHVNKVVVSVVRCPYERAISQYKFGWWKMYPIIEREHLKDVFPEFPEISFDAFLKYQQLLAAYLKTKHNIPENITIGFQSIEFIKFFSERPSEVFSNLSSYIVNNTFKALLPKITFLRQERLNKDLSLFLESRCFTDEEVNVAKNHKKENVTKYKDDIILSPEQIKIINQQEWILFDIMAQYGFDYKRQICTYNETKN